MKKFTLFFLKYCSITLFLVFFGIAANAWKPSDLTIDGQDNYDNTAAIHIQCQRLATSTIKYNLYLEVSREVDNNEVWQKAFHIKRTNIPLGYAYDYNPTSLYRACIASDYYAALSGWTSIGVFFLASPTGVYNTPVKFRIVEENIVKHNFTLTFYKIKPPQNLVVSKNVCNQVELSWDKPNNTFKKREETGWFIKSIPEIENKGYNYEYTIQRNDNKVFTTDKMSFIDTDVVDGKEYKYKVKIKESAFATENPTTYHEEQESYFSDFTSGYSKPRPEAPANVVASTNRCNGTVLVEWEWGVEAPDNFKVERSINADFSSAEVLRDDILGNRNYYEDTNPIKNVTYYYRVSVLNDCGDWGSISAIGEGYAPAIPETPANIYSCVLNDSIHLVWDNSGFEDKYVITRTNIKSGVENEYEVERDINWFNDGNAEFCTPYTYTVHAVNNCGISSKIISEEVVLTPDLSDTFWAGAFIASKGFYPDIVHLEWENNNRDLINSYYIYRKEYGSSDSTLLASLDGSLTTFDDDYAVNGVLYEYSIIAEKLCNTNSVFSNVVSDIGFKVPTGVVSGKVTYESGNPTPDVTLTAESTEIPEPTSIEFNGNSSYMQIEGLEESLKNSFTFQAYVKFSELKNVAVFKKGNQYKLSYSSGSFSFNVATTSLNVDYTPPIDTFIQLSAVFDGASSYLYIDGVLMGEQIVNGSPVDNSNDLIIGHDGESSFFKGYVDEIRLWQISLDSSTIASNYRSYINGNEPGLIGYYRLNENIAINRFFDISKTGNDFNENHGLLNNCTFVPVNPTIEQLWFRAVTDKTGNYLITGIPYLTGGSVYKIVPMLAPHEFNPQYKTLFVGEGATAHNNIDFVDISTVPVSLTVFYRDTEFPVKGVWVKVDGQYISDKNNSIVQTKEDGTVDFEVPIGDHYLTFEKQNHAFNNSVFPGIDSLGNIERHLFNQPISLSILDTTRVKIAGKIVGGPIEADKTLGSKVNPGINNIGTVNIELTTVKGAVIDASSKSKTISFSTDPNTGEFEIWLLPEQYRPNGALAIGNTKYKFNSDDDLGIIDLTNQFFDKFETDSIYSKNPGEAPVFLGLDTVSKYNLRKDWIYRSKPDFDVLNADGGKILSEIKFGFEGENGVVDSIPLATLSGNNITYTFGKPIFFFGQEYNLLIKAFEEYINNDNGTTDLVPVTDGKVIIANNLALNNKDAELKLNSAGEVECSFIADFPNIAAPYTKNLNITFKSAGSQITWPTMEAYILGGRPVGNNFVTAGPEIIDYILRDPPGSNSYAALAKGHQTSSAIDWQMTNTTDVSLGLAYQLGTSISTTAGTPVFQMQTDLETDNFIGVTVEASNTLGGGLESTTTTTFSEGFSTSDDPEFVGSDGDVFIGHSTNIIYGISKIMGITPTSEIQTGTNSIADHSSYSIAINDGLRVSPEFRTHFIYSQRIIEEEHIPHLIKLRNIILERDSYQIVFSNINDPKYGANNDDSDVWGNQASNADNGPSYIYTHIPVSGSVGEDSVRLYNKMIAHWETILIQNEKEKLAAKPDEHHENISFGAGSTYESSIGSEDTYTGRFIWDFSISVEVATSLGFSLNKAGFRFDGSIKNTTNSNMVVSAGHADTDEVGYTLSDGDPENYLTVDVLKCQSGHGPVFKLRGGQTSCPYEDEELTEYFEPGQHTLASATMKIDGPQISVDNPVAPIVPETAPALFTVNLSNVSEAEKDNWYILGVDLNSNPNGAKIKMDGSTINEGISVFVPYGTTVVKTLEVYKGRADVDDYENIGIYFSSQCDDDIADAVLISAYFSSACTPVEFEYPGRGWVVNTNDNDTLYVIASGYNLQHDGFEDFHFQYTPTGTTDWTTVHVFTNDITLTNEPNTTLINGIETVEYYWDMSSLPDRGYDIRLVSHCIDGSDNVSQVLTGILDGQRPQVFGTPQPADGILNVDDDIFVQFNEQIVGGLLTQFNFDIKGTLNNSPVKHDAFIRYDGSSDYSSIPEGVSFNDKPFTIEFWMKPDVYTNSVIFSQGNDPAQSIEIGLRDGDKTYFKIGSKEFVAPFQFSSVVPSNAWQHMAYLFDYETGDIFIYQNDVIILEIRGESIAVNNKGKIYIGKSSTSGGDYFEGGLHELRIWSKIWSIGDVYANQYNTLSGNEIGLYGYWPVDEAFGSLAADKAAYRHMEVFAPWEVYPGGKAWDFSGNKCVTFLSGYFAIIPEMDYTMEFWFKDGNPSDTVCLFSNQKGDGNDGDDLIEKALAVYATPDGKIWVASKGNLFQATTKNYFDNSWHHFALVVRRNGNVASYIDGQAQNEKENSLVGGLAGGTMALGVRKWDNVKGIGEDWHYQGKLDEFRLWNLAKTNTQVKMDMNSKLHGDEIGLMAYFPFEGYFDNGFGGLEMEETLANYVSDTNATDAVTCSTESFTSDASNIKDARPIEDISFDFVASEDGIILRPKEYLMAQLEKNIIEITVEGVEDKYGNRMASPVTWTAYVHRNQVRWEDERRNFNKEIYKELDFVASIKNTGGLQIGFDLINLPPWLSAQPSSGVVNPESTLEITFTINPALNIGEYNEDIILRTENGYDEKLPIAVRVFKTPPSWKVDPAMYEHTMNMVGQVKIEDVLSTDVFDKVAVFVNDSIRGVANVRYLKAFDSYMVFLNVYGNITGEQLEFRLWDASVGQILDDVKPFDVNFVPNGVVGTTLDPVLFEATGLYRQYLPLARGWNWVSFNKLAHNQNNLNSFFSAIEPLQNDQIKTHGGGFNNFDPSTGWLVGGIDSIDNQRMYQIKIGKNDTVVYSGESIIPEDHPIDLHSGWNHIAYIPDLSMDVNDALRIYAANTSEVIKSQYAFAMYDPRAGWLGTLDVMEPGLGYMINVNSASVLKYPNTTVFKSANIPQYMSPPLEWKNDLAGFEGNLSIVARLDLNNSPELVINDQMLLGAFINGDNRGYVVPILDADIGYDPFFLSVSNSMTDNWIEFKLFDGLTGNTYAVNETHRFEANAVLGSTQEPLILTVTNLLTGAGGIGELNQNFKCYPNPFNDHINIDFTTQGGEVQIDVLNATGALVKQIFNGYTSGGTNTIQWEGINGNGSEVSTGVYYIRFISGTKVETVKISKSK